MNLSRAKTERKARQQRSACSPSAILLWCTYHVKKLYNSRTLPTKQQQLHSLRNGPRDVLSPGTGMVPFIDCATRKRCRNQAMKCSLETGQTAANLLRGARKAIVDPKVRSSHFGLPVSMPCERASTYLCMCLQADAAQRPSA